MLPYAPEGLFGDKGNAMFAHVEDGICYLEAGDYSVSYEATRPLRKVYSVDTSLRELLSVPSIREFLTEKFPQVNQAPDHVRSNSLRDIAGHFGGSMEPGVLEQLDKALGKLG